MSEQALGRLDREVDQIERDMRDVRKRLDKVEAQIEKIARRDLAQTIPPHLTTVEIKSDFDALGR